MNLLREIMNLSPERIKRMNFLLLRIRAMIMVNVLILLLIFFTHIHCVNLTVKHQKTLGIGMALGQATSVGLASIATMLGHLGQLVSTITYCELLTVNN